MPTGDAARLRADFDRAFAAPPPAPPLAPTRLVVVGTASRAYAIPLERIALVQRLGRLAALPGNGDPSLLGVAGARGALLPVHRLATLVGDELAGEPRYLIALRHRVPLALAVERFLGYHLLAADALATRAGTGGYAGQARIGAELVPLIDVPALLTRLDRTATPP